MELAERYEAGIRELNKAINGLNAAITINPANYTAIEADLIRNGWLQKFEYCAELSWKLGKLLLEWKSGLVVSSPKNVYRELFSTGFIDENLCGRLLDTINDRNSMSHIYKEEMFNYIIEKIDLHTETFMSLLEIYNSENKGV